MTFRSTPLLGIISLASLSSCAVGPNFIKPETPVGANFANAKQSGYSTAETVSEWWRKFNDSTLNSLVERTLANNNDLKIAAARVEEARALRRLARFDYFPTAETNASYANSRISAASSPQGEPANAEFYAASVDAAWELDLWGKVRRNNWAFLADLQSAEATRQDAMVALSAETASAYLELRGLQNQLAVANRNAENQRQTLKLTESLLQGGRGTELDTSRARAQLNRTLAAIPLIESSIHRNIHRLSVLTGVQPTVLKSDLIKARPIPKLPSLVRISNPAELLRRRRDIRAAEKDLESATNRVGVNVADLFPSVTFNGSVALEARTLSGFGNSGAGAYTFGPSINWAAFNLGRVFANIDASKARVRGQAANYEKVVLNALEETENALVLFGRQRARRNFLSESANASEQAASLARERYQNGVADFLTVLDAERTLLEAQVLLAESETQTAITIVSIYRALGGGWESTGTNGKLKAK